MPSYIVKTGDTLSKIATGTLGSAGKWPMTDARQRAAVTRGYVVDGIISESKGSFVSSLAR